MIDIVFGRKNNPQAIDELVTEIKKLDLTGSLYIGYPIFDLNEASVLTDALLVTLEHGVIIFDLSTASEKCAETIEAYQDDLHRGLLKRFLSEKSLVKKRQLSFTLQVVSLRSTTELLDDVETISPADIAEYVENSQPLEPDQFKAVNAAIQKTSVLKPLKKRLNVTNETSFGATIKKIEKEIANLDQ